MAIGPELPPHLQAKRKRGGDDDSPPPQTAPSRVRSSSADSQSKRRRVLGPSLPPAPLDERPPEPAKASEESDETSSDDDDFGPSLPKAGQGVSAVKSQYVDEDEYSRPVEPDTRTRRDEWMMVPPKQDDLAARMDPTKIRAKGFNTGKGAKGPGQLDSDSMAWTETPEQKRKRLEDQVLGISKAETGAAAAPLDLRKKREDEEKARKIKEHNDKHRAKTLYEQHQGSSKKEKEDDPSARAFDYEKDMGGGMKIGSSQRRELLTKASNFGSKFAGGKYL